MRCRARSGWSCRTGPDVGGFYTLPPAPCAVPRQAIEKTLIFGLARFLRVTASSRGAREAANAGTLWFGNDYGGTDYHTTTTGTVLGTINESLTGVAWDGTTLFVSDR